MCLKNNPHSWHCLRYFFFLACPPVVVLGFSLGEKWCLVCWFNILAVLKARLQELLKLHAKTPVQSWLWQFLMCSFKDVRWVNSESHMLQVCLRFSWVVLTCLTRLFWYWYVFMHTTHWKLLLASLSAIGCSSIVISCWSSFASGSSSISQTSILSSSSISPVTIENTACSVSTNDSTPPLSICSSAGNDGLSCRCVRNFCDVSAYLFLKFINVSIVSAHSLHTHFERPSFSFT